MKFMLSSEIIAQVSQLFEDMEEAYAVVASKLQLSCTGCSDNCCDSYFLHHTYLEWAYLWYGMEKLSKEKRQEIIGRAEEYTRKCEECLEKDIRPRLMCPLNENGRCVLYQYRLMVCRTHGVPATMIRPDGKRLSFPGCFVSQELVENRFTDKTDVPAMERTELLRRMVILEQNILDGKRHLVPKVKMTIAEMIVAGPPTIPHCINPAA